MTLKVIGAGLGRTGTMSLKLALEALGIGRCYHMIEVFENPGAPELWVRAAEGAENLWEDIFKGYSATVDWPSASFYDKLARHYPDAKIILTVRDPDAWFESTQKTIFKDLDKLLEVRNDAWTTMSKAVIVKMFDGRLHDRAHATAVFRAHNERVKRIIPPERLLIHEAGDGWAPLCGFLGLPIPTIPYPKTNAAEDFAALHASRRAQLGL